MKFQVPIQLNIFITLLSLVIPLSRSHFVVSLKNILRQKLLHLGVNTTDILTAYITAIRALRILDPSGVLLELVCEPVRKYLRTRDDTVR